MSTINNIQEWINNLGQCHNEESIKNWIGKFPGKIADTTMDAYKNIIMYDIPSVDSYITNIIEDGVPQDKDKLATAIYIGLMNSNNPDNEVIEDKLVEQYQNDQDSESMINKVNDDIIENTSEVDTPAEHPSEDDITANRKINENPEITDEKNFDAYVDPYSPNATSAFRMVQKPLELLMGKTFNLFHNPDVKSILASIIALGGAAASFATFFNNVACAGSSIPKGHLLKLMLWCGKNWKQIMSVAVLAGTIPALYIAIGRLMSKDPSFGLNQDYAKFVAQEYAKLYPAKYKAYTQYRFSEYSQLLSEKNLCDMILNYSAVDNNTASKLINNEAFSDEDLITILTESGYDLNDAMIKKAYLLKLLNDPFFRERIATYIFSDLPEDMRVLIMDEQNFSSGVSNAISGVAKSKLPESSTLLKRLIDIAEDNASSNRANIITRAVKANNKKNRL